MSTPSKSALMWNIVDPDDPYDIRKSMIARLPDHNPNVMSEHLELVCLFQAAEILRITEYLEQFKVKFRELERKELDRHSYEVLIREMTEKLNLLKETDNQNFKLKEYLKKLTVELEEVKQKLQVNEHNSKQSALSMQYTELIQKYEALLNNLQTTRESLNRAQVSEKKMSEEFLQLRINYDRLDKQRTTDLAAQRQKYELRVRQKIEASQRQLKNIHQTQIHALESRVRASENDCQMYKHQLETKNYEIVELKGQIRGLETQLRGLQAQETQRNNQLQEFNQVNETLKIKTDELEQIFGKYQSLEAKLRDMEQYCQRFEAQNQGQRAKREQVQAQLAYLQNDNKKYKQELQSKINQLTKLQKNISQVHNEQYENKLALLSSEIERLGSLLFTKKEEVRTLTEKGSSLSSKLTLLEQQNNNLHHKNRDLEFRMTMMSNESANQARSAHTLNELQDEVKKLYTTIKLKDEQIYNLETKIRTQFVDQQQLAHLKSSLLQTENTLMALKQQNNQLHHDKQDIENNRTELRRELEAEVFQNRELKKNIAALQGEIRQLEKKSISEEAINKIKENHEAESSRREQQLRGLEQKHRQKCEQFNFLERQNQEMKTELQNLGQEIRRKNEEIQLNKLAKNNEAHLNAKIRELQNASHAQKLEVGELRQRLASRDQEIQDTSYTVEKKYADRIEQLIREVTILRHDNEQIQQEKKKLRDSLESLERDLSSKERELSTLQHTLSQQNEQLRHQVQSLQSEVDMFPSRTHQLRREAEEKYTQRYRSQLNQKDRIIESLEGQIQTLKLELTHAKSLGSEDNIQNLKQRLIGLSNEIERLTSLLKSRDSQYSSLSQEVVKHNAKRKHLEEEVEAHRAQIAELNKAIARYQAENQGLKALQDEESNKMAHGDSELEKARQEINSLRARSLGEEHKQRYETEIINLKEALRQLSEISEHTVAERDELYSICHQLEAKLDGHPRNIETQNTNEINKIVESLETKHRQACQEIQSYYKRIIAMKEQQEQGLSQRLITKVEQELSAKYEGALQAKEQELRELQNKFNEIHKYSHQLQIRISHYEGQEREATQFLDQIPAYEQRIRELEQDVSHYYAHLQQYEAELSDRNKLHEIHTGRLNAEIQRLKVLLPGNRAVLIHDPQEANQIAALRIKIQKMRAELAIKEDNLEVWEEKYMKLYQSYQELSGRRSGSDREYDSLLNKQKSFEAEFYKLNEIIKALKVENQLLKEGKSQLMTDASLQEKNRLLSSEIDRLTPLAESLEQELRDTRIRLTDQTALQKRIEEYMAVMVILFAEIETLRNRVSQTEQECENVRRSSLTPCRVDRARSSTEGRR